MQKEIIRETKKNDDFTPKWYCTKQYVTSKRTSRTPITKENQSE